jgi:hypothetical protein
MTRPASEVEAVLELVAEGRNDLRHFTGDGDPRGTVREWRIYRG